MACLAKEEAHFGPRVTANASRIIPKQMARNKTKTPEVCPVCSEPVPKNALACPECGADHNSGWREDASYDALDLPDEDFDYNEFVRQEFGSSFKPAGLKTIWWLTAIFIIVASVVLYFLSGR